MQHLIGREREIATLDDLIDHVDECGAALVMRGEAGAGKSALLASACARAEARGMHGLTSTGVQSEAHLPFAGLHQLLRPILGEAANLPDPQRDALSAAFGMTSTAAPDLFLIALMLAGQGASTATVAISPAPFRGVLPLPPSALKSSSAVLGNPLNYNRAVPLTFEQFKYGFANAVDENEANTLYETFAVPGSGVPIFQAATANLNPWTEDTVDTKNPERGPLLIVSGEKDHTVPPAIASAAYKLEQKIRESPSIPRYPTVAIR